jgi:hypothetical protein
MDLEYLQRVISRVDSYLDASYERNSRYRGNALAIDWARTTKVCEEAGEVWRGLSDATNENGRRNIPDSDTAFTHMLRELGDTALAALLAIQHHTKDIERTWAIFTYAANKGEVRAERFFAANPELDISTEGASVEADPRKLYVDTHSTPPEFNDREIVLDRYGNRWYYYGKTDIWYCNAHARNASFQHMTYQYGPITKTGEVLP